MVWFTGRRAQVIEVCLWPQKPPLSNQRPWRKAGGVLLPALVRRSTPSTKTRADLKRVRSRLTTLLIAGEDNWSTLNCAKLRNSTRLHYPLDCFYPN